MSDWVRQQERNFSKNSVIEEALANPIQRGRIDVAVKMVGGPGLKVLDVGCGDGAISQLFHDNGNECWGMDLPAVVATVPAGRTWLHRLEGDASKKPWTIRGKWSPNPGELLETVSSEFFDVVFAGEIIEHMIDIEPFLSEAWRVLKPGGHIVLTTPNAVRALNRVAMLFGQVQTWHEWTSPPHHVRYFTPQTIVDALQKYGFELVEMGTAQSQAEGSELGFNASWLEPLSPSQRKAVVEIIDRFCPTPVWRHSFIIVKARKEVKPAADG